MASRRAAGRFRKANPATRAGRAARRSSSLLIATLNEPVYATIDGKRRKITKRQAIITQMVNESASVNLRATKMLFDMMKEVEQKAGAAAPPEPPKLTAIHGKSSICLSPGCAARSPPKRPRQPKRQPQPT